MRYHAIALVMVLAVVVVGGVSLGAEAAEGREWRTCELAGAGPVSVRIAVQRRATLADTRWMRLEFVNAAEAPVRVRDASYRIESERLDLASGKPLSSGGLGSGNTFDLFPEAWRTTPISPIVLSQGTRSVADSVSDYAAMLLGMPQKDLRVGATVHLRLTLPDGTELQTPQAGVPIAFEWIQPDEQGLKQLQQRFLDLLGKPEDKFHHGALLNTLLATPSVSGVASLDKLLEALSRRKGPFDGRDALARHLAAHHAKDPAVIGYYADALRRGDHRAVEDLWGHGAAIWDDGFVPLLARLCQEAAELQHALAVLSRHFDRWKEDAALPPRLAEAVIKAEPILLKPPGDIAAQQWFNWNYAADLLGMTHDRNSIRLLEPYLACKTVVHTHEHDAMLTRDELPVPTRACDVAYNNILLMLGREGESMSLGPTLGGVEHPTRESVERAPAERDKRIAGLAAELRQAGR